ncbi:hypothetical protein QMG61_06370 [Cryobacterium sp. PH31-AA6]|uniref:hypothetical protein n=1 Tax=Cryobacterium sp. PH31-AA6 TaxID=3046205 RepID=UPI0024BB7003|nr:hypothetical protein [Cryobacterium sp. PH31-AA6]MDJ0323386.1 hypothetical protein [Cryobacterium sp. PH31-AA6]
MNTTTTVPATTVADLNDPFDRLEILPCESFGWCEGHEAGERKHKPEEKTHLGEDKTIWHETTAEPHMMDWDVLAQRMRIGLNGADTIAISFQIDGRLSMLEVPGFALALEGMAAKFRAIAGEIS